MSEDELNLLRDDLESDIAELEEKVNYLSEENAKLYTQVDSDALKRAKNTERIEKLEKEINELKDLVNAYRTYQNNCTYADNIRGVLREVIENTYLTISSIINIGYEIGLKKDGQLKSTLSEVCETLDNLNRRLDGENRFKGDHTTTGSGTLSPEPSGNRVSFMEKKSHDSTDSNPSEPKMGHQYWDKLIENYNKEKKELIQEFLDDLYRIMKAPSDKKLMNHIIEYWSNIEWENSGKE